MKIKISETTPLQLDWLVTSIECPDDLKYGVDDWRERRCREAKRGEFVFRWHQSWAQGGPIIEREKIDTRWTGEDWVAGKLVGWLTGPTPLIAAMRCYVASKLGDEVDVPDNL